MWIFSLWLLKKPLTKLYREKKIETGLVEKFFLNKRKGEGDYK